MPMMTLEWDASFLVGIPFNPNSTFALRYLFHQPCYMCGATHGARLHVRNWSELRHMLTQPDAKEVAVGDSDVANENSTSFRTYQNLS